MSLQILRVEPDHWQRLRRARLAALAESPSMFGSTLAKEQTLDEDEWRTRARRPATFLAVRDGVDVGLSGVYELDGEWSVMGMWIDPGARGAGIVDALMAACLAVVRDAGGGQVELCVMRDNPRAARTYERLGFIRSSDGDPDADGCREVLMHRSM